MLKIEKADPELMQKAMVKGGKQIYPFDKMEVGDTFFASFADYIKRNGKTKYKGADRELSDLRNAIFSASMRVRPMRFSIVKKHHGDTALVIGFDVVRVV